MALIKLLSRYGQIYYREHSEYKRLNQSDKQVKSQPDTAQRPAQVPRYETNYQHRYYTAGKYITEKSHSQ